MAKKIKITQFKSGIGYERDQKDTLRILGLGKIRRSVIHDASPQILGMVNKVRHLVKFEDYEEGSE